MPKSTPKHTPQTILVTGGAGFVGSHLCAALLAQGHHVTALDNFHTGTHANLAPLTSNPRFSVITHDVTHPFPTTLPTFTHIYNLACPASPVHYQADALHTTRTCVLGALHVLDLAHRTGAIVLQASTSEVYGDPSMHPQPESYWGHVNPIGPRSCYDEGKRCAETLFFDYHRQHNVAIKVVRIFNTYGPNMTPNDGRVVSNFIMQALKGQPITLYGTGHQTRSFCYVSDLVAGIIAMMNTGPDVLGPINLGNPGEFTMHELAALVLQLTGSSSPLVHMPLPTDDPRQRRPDITLAQQHLGWAPTITLAAGLVDTIAYFKQHI